MTDVTCLPSTDAVTVLPCRDSDSRCQRPVPSAGPAPAARVVVPAAASLSSISRQAPVVLTSKM